ncbi:MAG: hypothetical protein AAF640_12185, partial [Pseudomonadota bacterium]
MTDDSEQTAMNGAGTRPEILIVNQHGENRGDEAAMRAMIEACSCLRKSSRFQRNTDPFGVNNGRPRPTSSAKTNSPSY